MTQWPLRQAGAAPAEYARHYEHGNCGLAAVFSRDGRPDRAVLERVLTYLGRLAHRSGSVEGEGDGCGIQTDIPRALWAGRLEEAGLDPELARHPSFAVAHLFVSSPSSDLVERIRHFLARRGIRLLVSCLDRAVVEALGPRGRRQAPAFWQLALMVDPPGVDGWWRPGLLPFEGDGTLGSAQRRLSALVGSRLFESSLELERAFESVHVVSMSAHTVVYKVLGDVGHLQAFYPDLQDPAFATRAAIGHNRYSTNTMPTFDRAQPFTVLAHNGEINTIRRLVMEAEQVGIPTILGGSDSQNLNRTADAMLHRMGYSLMETLEILFPPILNEIKRYPAEWQEYYMYLRQAWGPFAQGPAAIFARHRDMAVMAADALGLRPLWYVPAQDVVVFSSEPGVVPTRELVSDPKPLGPGEKMAVLLEPGGARVLAYPYLQEWVVERWKRRIGAVGGFARWISPARAFASPAGAGSEPGPVEEAVLQRLMAAWAWQADDVKILEDMARSGAEPIGSLGYDAPLAALSPELHNLADYFKETVAVVTNPAIDRDREIEHFSTRVVVGRRPALKPAGGHGDMAARPGAIELLLPVCVGGAPQGSALDLESARRVAASFETLAWPDLVAGLCATVVPVRRRRGETTVAALHRTARQASEAVSSGSALVVLDDGGVFEDEAGTWMDPHLVVAFVDRALRQAAGLRRRAGIVVRSGALRNLHDVMLALGLGADVVVPWMMVELAARSAVAAGQSAEQGVAHLLSALHKGMEKVISTLGIHEIRGYARLFSCIGLKPELAVLLEVEAYAASDGAGVGFQELEQSTERRRALATGEGGSEPRLVRPFHYWPRIWKALAQAAEGAIPYAAAARQMEELERAHPVALRHLLALRPSGSPLEGPVDLSVGEHSLPFVISSMSFGSQGERAYRAYLEAAVRANIVCLNGEGGEIPDLVGRWPRHRGIQVASGRFGVHAEMLNGAWVIEIKIGQGAKPGEGGHLPGRKVSAKVARARNARAGVDLISPSNNHDIYSIEDLAQLIHELRTVSPASRIAVKVPVVPGIGTIAVGIAKAGADVINLSGFDGGTGAARRHAIRHVGLPAEIGIAEAHRALVASGLRHQVEIWADGGMKSALDAMKSILLGANRVGFGTLAMVAIGCTICRGCQLDTCHVGIATQIEEEREALERGLKHFVPRDEERAAAQLASLLEQMGEELATLTRQLGARRTQDLVGRVDLLEQVALHSRVDLSELLRPAVWAPVAHTGVSLPQPLAATNERPEPGRLSLPAGSPLVVEQAVAVRERLLAGDHRVEWETDRAACSDRVLATPVAGQLARLRLGLEGRANGWHQSGARITVRGAASVGNGAAAFNTEGVDVTIEGGAQDGAGKCALGGRLVVLKGVGAGGRRVNGCVGKSFAYGAQRGRFFVQGEADSRAAIRLSGADVVFGAMPRVPLDDSRASAASTAQLKGFAFEYMTNGRAVVLGDPGPWICSGMTGGVVYLRLAPQIGLDEYALRRRIAKGARVQLGPIDDTGERDIRELLGEYAELLRASGQVDEAMEVDRLARSCREQFVAVRPVGQQVDVRFSTE
ncbi:glutamate synthase-related protein [Carboxydochorda subterranea]|uniref:Glutamate synthase-related protein n=1 Tax=Carboxydichorda subterranea TaxID=3109565 RepID=A0ABZ1BXV0_9FIRM|nr:glutamate synthase-related protein [Limnochorda sp. L945t]WRP17634.1 glutamate synthase-related protein [Limnochorda sp. L945t]